MDTINIVVKGKVQGVYFRHFVREKAIQYGLSGYVKNLADGSVFILAQGKKEALDYLLAWCHNGSPQSFVETLRIDKMDGNQVMDGFEIIR